MVKLDTKKLVVGQKAIMTNKKGKYANIVTFLGINRIFRLDGSYSHEQYMFDSPRGECFPDVKSFDSILMLSEI